jgi:hypothetical protein
VDGCRPRGRTARHRVVHQEPGADLDAVTNSLTMNWSTCPDEGLLNRKMVNRSTSSAP